MPKQAQMPVAFGPRQPMPDDGMAQKRGSMMKREQIIERAQGGADRTGKTLAVLNLNTVGAAMYVIREYNESMETGHFAHQFVAKVEPRT